MGKPQYQFGQIKGEIAKGQAPGDCDVLFVVSLNNDNCTGDRFRSTLFKLTQQFRSVTLIIPSTLYAHNILAERHIRQIARKVYQESTGITDSITDRDITDFYAEPGNQDALNRALEENKPTDQDGASAKRVAQIKGQEWFQAHQEAILSCMDVSKVYAWDEFKDNELPRLPKSDRYPTVTYEMACARVNDELERNQAYQRAVNLTVNSFKQKGKLGSWTNFFEESSRAFVLEELAVILQWQVFECELLIYPGTFSKAMLSTKDLLLKPNVPFGELSLEPCEIKFQQAPYATKFALPSDGPGARAPSDLTRTKVSGTRQRLMEQVNLLISSTAPSSPQSTLSFDVAHIEQYYNAYKKYIALMLKAVTLSPEQGFELYKHLMKLFIDNLDAHFTVTAPQSEKKQQPAKKRPPIEVDITALTKRGIPLHKQNVLFVCLVDDERCRGEFLRNTLRKLKTHYKHVHIMIADTLTFHNELLENSGEATSLTAKDIQAQKAQLGKQWLADNLTILVEELDLNDGAIEFHDALPHMGQTLSLPNVATTYTRDQIFFWDGIPANPIYDQETDTSCYSAGFQDCADEARRYYDEGKQFTRHVDTVVQSYLKKNHIALSDANKARCRSFVLERCASLRFWKKCWTGENQMHALAHIGTVDAALKFYQANFITEPTQAWLEPMDIQFIAPRVPLKIDFAITDKKTLSVKPLATSSHIEISNKDEIMRAQKTIGLSDALLSEVLFKLLENYFAVLSELRLDQTTSLSLLHNALEHVVGQFLRTVETETVIKDIEEKPMVVRPSVLSSS